MDNRQAGSLLVRLPRPLSIRYARYRGIHERSCGMERVLHVRTAGLLAIVLCLIVARSSLFADEPAPPKKDPPAAAANPAQDQPATPPADDQAARVVQLAEQARKSVVVVTISGRDGRQQGLGTGFVVSPDG